MNLTNELHLKLHQREVEYITDNIIICYKIIVVITLSLMLWKIIRLCSILCTLRTTHVSETSLYYV